MSTTSADSLVGAVGRPLVWALRRLRSAPSHGVAESIRLQRSAHERTVMILRAFYGLSLVWTVQEMGTWPGLLDVEAIDPQGPAGWIDTTDPGGDITLILLLFGFGSFLAALWPMSRTFRIMYALGLLEYLSVKFGFGKVNHNLHAWLWVSGFFVFLPSARRLREPDARTRQSTLSVVWSAQVLVLFFYTLTGVWKVAYGLHAFTSERISSFQLEGFSLIVGERLLATDQSALLGEFFVRNEVLGWMLFNGTVYLEAAALLVAFRPRLHRLWGGGLIAFHIGTQLAMGFTFIQNIALLALLFMASPLAPERVTVKEVFLDLPGIHLLAGLLVRKRRTRPETVVATPQPAET